MKKPISLLLSMVLAGGLLIVALAPAFAHQDETSSASTSTTMSYKGRTDKFKGQLSSGKPKCLGHRTVKVFKITRKGNVPLGSTTTDGSGLWTKTVKDAKGKYGAKVVAQQITLDFELDKYGEMLWEHVLNCKEGSASTTV